MSLLAQKSNRTVTIKNLESVTHTWSSLDGLQSVPAVAKTWIPYFVSWLKMGYDVFKVPISALTSAQWRASARANKSDRSTYSALSWLENNDYLHRQKFRIGENRFNAVITLNHSRFEFFLRQSRKTTCDPLPYNRSPLQVLQNDKVTSKPKFGSDIGVFSSSNKSNLHAKSQRDNPVKYSCKCVLAKRRDPSGFKTLRRIDAELSGNVPPSVDWTHWSDRWYDLLLPEREYIAKTQIIPMVQNHTESGSKGGNRACKDLDTKTATVKREKTALTDDEYRILYWAQQNAGGH